MSRYALSVVPKRPLSCDRCRNIVSGQLFYTFNKYTYRPDLSVGGQLEHGATDFEVQALDLGVLGGREAIQPGVLVPDRASGIYVLLQGIYVQVK